MNPKTRDCVFSLILLAAGAFVVTEGLGMVRSASGPPLRIESFSISPGMLPTVLGAGLLGTALLLLAVSLRNPEGEGSAPAGGHLRHAAGRFSRAVADRDMRSMAAGVVIMAAHTFLLLGRLPFWASSAVFLVGLMLYLRAARTATILGVSGAVIAGVILLFETVFGTTLP